MTVPKFKGKEQNTAIQIMLITQQGGTLVDLGPYVQ